MEREHGPGPRRLFSAEFKAEAVRLLEERARVGVPMTQVGRELGVHPDVLRRWRRQLAAQPGVPLSDVFPGPGQQAAAEEELRRLRREVEVLKQERDFLKRAAAFFARESR